MVCFLDDPINNAIYGKHGIKASIENAFNGGFHMSALILIFCGIDAMAYLVRPVDQGKNFASDFKKWSCNYIKLDGDAKVTDDDLWGARCAIIHTYGQESEYVKSGRARQVTWALGNNVSASCIPDPEKHPNHIIIELGALKNAFLNGIDKFLQDVFARTCDEYDKALVEERLQELNMFCNDPGILNYVSNKLKCQ